MLLPFLFPSPSHPVFLGRTVLPGLEGPLYTCPHPCAPGMPLPLLRGRQEPMFISFLSWPTLSGKSELDPSVPWHQVCEEKAVKMCARRRQKEWWELVNCCDHARGEVETVPQWRRAFFLLYRSPNRDGLKPSVMHAFPVTPQSKPVSKSAFLPNYFLGGCVFPIRMSGQTKQCCQFSLVFISSCKASSVGVLLNFHFNKEKNRNGSNETWAFAL